jgi:type IV pilus assembly protein PilP
MKRYDLLIASMLALTLLAGCEVEQPTPTPPTPSKAVVKPAAPAAAVPAPEAAQVVEDSRFIYALQGRRDPFVPITGKRVASFTDNPLESFDLLQFQLKGVIVGMGEPKAVVAAPDGKAYILKKGLRIGKSGGVIRDITREKVLVEEHYQDLSGVTRTIIQEIKVPTREGV